MTPLGATVQEAVSRIMSARGGRIDAGGGLFAGGPFAAGLIAGGLFASGLNAATPVISCSCSGASTSDECLNTLAISCSCRDASTSVSASILL